MLSAEHYQTLKQQQNQPSLPQRKKAFKAEYASWIAAQNALVGVLRPLFKNPTT